MILLYLNKYLRLNYNIWLLIFWSELLKLSLIMKKSQMHKLVTMDLLARKRIKKTINNQNLIMLKENKDLKLILITETPNKNQRGRTIIDYIEYKII